MSTTNLRDAVALIAAGKPFVGSSMSADLVTYPYPGRLPEEHEIALRADAERARKEGKPLYVVFSYSTPIAWRVGDEGPVVPNVRYSNITSKHQSVVRHAYGVTR